MKKTEIKRLDNLWSDLVKMKAGYKCEMCGKATYLNSHHVYSRSNRALRWDSDNGVCLCSGHHTLCNNSAHKAPADFIDWIVSERGEGWLNELRTKRNIIAKNQIFKEIELDLCDEATDILISLEMKEDAI